MQDSLTADLYETLYEDPLTYVPLLLPIAPGPGVWCLLQSSANSCPSTTIDGARAEVAVAAFLYDLADNASTANSTPGADDDPVAYGPSWVLDVVTDCQVQEFGNWIRSNGPDHWIYCMERRLGGYAAQGYFPSRAVSPTAFSQLPVPPGWSADVVKGLWQGLLYANGPVPPPALSAQLLGPSPVKPSQSCTWAASPSGGVPPYTYVWKKNGSTMYGETGVQVTTSFSSTGSLDVRVTDDVGTQVSKTKTIYVQSSAQPCPQ